MWYLITKKTSDIFELVQGDDTSSYSYMWFNIRGIHKCLENKRHGLYSVNHWISIHEATIIATFTRTPTISSIKQWFNDHPELLI